MQRLKDYFTQGIGQYSLGETIGMEVETQFLDPQGKAISLETSQKIIREITTEYSWKITASKANLITEITSTKGDKISYELGRHNIELGTIPLPRNQIIEHTKEQLNLLYAVADKFQAEPLFGPILETNDNLLAIPDERDAIWLKLDGQKALNLLTRCSAVQFTIDLPPEKVIICLNRIGCAIKKFLVDYPQDELWKKYIETSLAGYDPLRYGGPLCFEDLNDYCRQLAQHKVVQGLNLNSLEKVIDLDIPLFLRSIWWYFRLKRYGQKLCLEVRPLARHQDKAFAEQLELVMDSLN